MFEKPDGVGFEIPSLVVRAFKSHPCTILTMV